MWHVCVSVYTTQALGSRSCLRLFCFTWCCSLRPVFSTASRSILACVPSLGYCPLVLHAAERQDLRRKSPPIPQRAFRGASETEAHPITAFVIRIVMGTHHAQPHGSCPHVCVQPLSCHASHSLTDDDAQQTTTTMPLPEAPRFGSVIKPRAFDACGLYCMRVLFRTAADLFLFLQWKKYLTTMQITQFVIDLLVVYFARTFFSFFRHQSAGVGVGPGRAPATGFSANPCPAHDFHTHSSHLL